MSDTTPHDEPDEVEALTGQTESDESAGPDAQRDAAEPAQQDGGVDADREVDLGSGAPEESAADPGVDDTDVTGQDVDDAGTGTGDTTDDPELDSPD
ncbi:hypothetical protein [Agrococcus jejuensis]|uniref:Uncharacterized protein n=1 Tax=Agrococcus jejuensis TaxID=399736 RepID=A0A1G8CY71_9MICO|nr:hypothetical protein [Agrococcus jejuensis]SDH50461.1 hypothetical protein SAMN04489720_1453 [Agrococcus jejuensis]